MKFQKLISVFCTLYSVLVLSGCASLPKKELLPTYNINGVTYFTLLSLCEARGINWDYDTVTRTAVLSKKEHKFNLMVGQRLVLVDGIPKMLESPVDIYQGTVVVPHKFKEEVLDPLFKETLIGKAALPPLRLKKIVVDAGHGGNDPGAIGRTGTKEKHITLDLAKRLTALLRDAGIDVVMTRSSDNFVSLTRRAQIANASGAELFISIHANANRVKSLNGFEVYCVRADANDYERANISAAQGTLDLDQSYFASNSLVLKTILWDMIHNHNRAESLNLASLVDRAVGRSLDARILGTKRANFCVLKDTQMPAILIEVGFLSNYNEERKLKNSYYRQQVANAIAQGLEDYARDRHLAKGYGQ